MNPSSAWFLAISAFINISTLENRVQLLSKAQIEAQELAREMELGKAVQDTFYRPPLLPSFLDLHYFHEAMLYVSGDTFFANWQEECGRLSAVICDITGHGVQAALKASGVHSLATSVWGEQNPPVALGFRIQQFSQLLDQFFNRIADKADFPSFLGFELDSFSGRLILQGKNFPNPVLIEKTPAGQWLPKIISLGRGQACELEFKAHSILVLASDGLIDGSRAEKALHRHLVKELPNFSSDLTTEGVKDLILAYADGHTQLAKDDRSLVIFQMKLEEAGTETLSERQLAMLRPS